MVSTSMLPVSGMTELSAMPSNTRPGPPRRRRCCQAVIDQTVIVQRVVASNGCGWRSIQVSGVYSLGSGLRYTGFRGTQELDRRRGRQRSNLGRVAIEKLQTFETGRVEIVVNIFGEIGA